VTDEGEGRRERTILRRVEYVLVKALVLLFLTLRAVVDTYALEAPGRASSEAALAVLSSLD